MSSTSARRGSRVSSLKNLKKRTDVPRSHHKDKASSGNTSTSTSGRHKSSSSSSRSGRQRSGQWTKGSASRKTRASGGTSPSRRSAAHSGGSSRSKRKGSSGSRHHHSHASKDADVFVTRTLLIVGDFRASTKASIEAYLNSWCESQDADGDSSFDLTTYTNPLTTLLPKLSSSSSPPSSAKKLKSEAGSGEAMERKTELGTVNGDAQSDATAASIKEDVEMATKESRSSEEKGGVDASVSEKLLNFVTVRFKSTRKCRQFAHSMRRQTEEDVTNGRLDQILQLYDDFPSEVRKLSGAVALKRETDADGDVHMSKTTPTTAVTKSSSVAKSIIEKRNDTKTGLGKLDKTHVASAMCESETTTTVLKRRRLFGDVRCMFDPGAAVAAKWHRRCCEAVKNEVRALISVQSDRVAADASAVLRLRKRARLDRRRLLEKAMSSDSSSSSPTRGSRRRHHRHRHRERHRHGRGKAKDKYKSTASSSSSSRRRHQSSSHSKDEDKDKDKLPPDSITSSKSRGRERMRSPTKSGTSRCPSSASSSERSTSTAARRSVSRHSTRSIRSTTSTAASTRSSGSKRKSGTRSRSSRSDRKSASGSSRIKSSASGGSSKERSSRRKDKDSSSNSSGSKYRRRKSGDSKRSSRKESGSASSSCGKKGGTSEHRKKRSGMSLALLRGVDVPMTLSDNELVAKCPELRLPVDDMLSSVLALSLERDEFLMPPLPQLSTPIVVPSVDYSFRRFSLGLDADDDADDADARAVVDASHVQDYGVGGGLLFGARRPVLVPGFPEKTDAMQWLLKQRMRWLELRKAEEAAAEAKVKEETAANTITQSVKTETVTVKSEDVEMRREDNGKGKAGKCAAIVVNVQRKDALDTGTGQKQQQQSRFSAVAAPKKIVAAIANSTKSGYKSMDFSGSFSHSPSKSASPLSKSTSPRSTSKSLSPKSKAKKRTRRRNVVIDDSSSSEDGGSPQRQRTSTCSPPPPTKKRTRKDMEMERVRRRRRSVSPKKERVNSKSPAAGFGKRKRRKLSDGSSKDIVVVRSDGDDEEEEERHSDSKKQVKGRKQKRCVFVSDDSEDGEEEEKRGATAKVTTTTTPKNGMRTRTRTKARSPTRRRTTSTSLSARRRRGVEAVDKRKRQREEEGSGSEQDADADERQEDEDNEDEESSSSEPSVEPATPKSAATYLVESLGKGTFERQQSEVRSLLEELILASIIKEQRPASSTDEKSSNGTVECVAAATGRRTAAVRGGVSTTKSPANNALSIDLQVSSATIDANSTDGSMTIVASRTTSSDVASMTTVATAVVSDDAVEVVDSKHDHVVVRTAHVLQHEDVIHSGTTHKEAMIGTPAIGPSMHTPSSSVTTLLSDTSTSPRCDTSIVDAVCDKQSVDSLASASTVTTTDTSAAAAATSIITETIGSHPLASAASRLPIDVAPMQLGNAIVTRCNEVVAASSELTAKMAPSLSLCRRNSGSIGDGTATLGLYLAQSNSPTQRVATVGHTSTTIPIPVVISPKSVCEPQYVSPTTTQVQMVAKQSKQRMSPAVVLSTGTLGQSVSLEMEATAMEVDSHIVDTMQPTPGLLLKNGPLLAAETGASTSASTTATTEEVLVDSSSTLTAVSVCWRSRQYSSADQFLAECSVAMGASGGRSKSPSARREWAHFIRSDNSTAKQKARKMRTHKRRLQLEIDSVPYAGRRRGKKSPPDCASHGGERVGRRRVDATGDKDAATVGGGGESVPMCDGRKAGGGKTECGSGDSTQPTTRKRRRRAAAKSGDHILSFNTLSFREKSLRFDKSNIHSWGMFALEDIGKDQMVIEYIGEYIDNAMADDREKAYRKMGFDDYMFRFDAKTVIDATLKGNNARFINHSCEPNCVARPCVVRGTPRVVIYSQQSIQTGAELTYDYNFPKEDTDRIPCLCGSANCKGFLN